MKEYATHIPCSRNFLSLTIEHGIKQENDDYSHVLLPNKNTKETEEYKVNPDIQILHNTSDAQAVNETVQNLTASNFFKHDPVKAEFIRSYGSYISDCQKIKGEMSATVSDPTKNKKKQPLS